MLLASSRLRRALASAASILAALLPLTTSAKAQVFVDAAAGPGGNGTGWATAYDSLDTAIFNSPPGSELWVKAGTYMPGNLLTGFLVNKQLKLYGGFAGGEAFLNQRAGLFSTTILEGNTTSGVAGHVVTVTGVSSNPAVLVDGFRITHGNTTAQGVGVGGGIYCFQSDLDLVNCLVDDNFAGLDGGGLYFEGVGETLHTLRIKLCEFRDDDAENDGGAIFAVRVRGTIVSTTFATNSALHDGGAVHLSGMLEGASNLMDLTNCVFWKNHATSDFSTGGAIKLDLAPEGGPGFARLLNCTLAVNYLDAVALAGAEGQALDVSSTSAAWVLNSILYFNYLASPTPTTKPTAGPVTVDWSDVEEWPTPANSTNLDVDPKFRSLTYANGLTLKGTSQCIDRANYNHLPDDVLDLDGNGVTAEKLPHDMNGDSRFFDRQATQNLGAPSGQDWLDMGAYERRD